MNQRFGQVASYSSKILLLPFLPFDVLVFGLVVNAIFTETFGELVMDLICHLLFSNTFGQLQFRDKKIGEMSVYHFMQQLTKTGTELSH